MIVVLNIHRFRIVLELSVTRSNAFPRTNRVHERHPTPVISRGAIIAMGSGGFRDPFLFWIFVVLFSNSYQTSGKTFSLSKNNQDDSLTGLLIPFTKRVWGTGTGTVSEMSVIDTDRNEVGGIARSSSKRCRRRSPPPGVVCDGPCQQ